jgi:hypothetical protein
MQNGHELAALRVDISHTSMITNSLSKLIILAVVASVSFVSCKKEDEDVIDPATKNMVFVEFENRVGDQKLVLGATPYKNALGEDFTVTTFNYFISNVSLKNENGTVQKFPNQYFLVRQVDAKSQVIQLKDVPSGNYTEMTFTVGVDSLKSISPVTERIGALDVTSYGDDGMYWSWNSGYIFLKIEGISSVVPVRTSGDKLYQLHVGGYGGGFNGGAKVTNNLRTVTLPINTKATVRGNIAPEIHLLVDAKKVFDGPNKISLATTNSVHSPAIATPIADNYKAMFVVDHVHNDKQ